MLHEEFESPEELRDAIKCFWYNCREAEEHPSPYEVMPDGYAEIIFHFGELYSVAPDGERQPLPSPFMVGLLNQPVFFYTPHRLEIIAVRCFPWTVFDLLGLSAGKDSVRIFNHPVAGLQSVLREHVQAGDIAAAINVVKQYFLDARVHVAPDSMLFKAGVAMRKANGNIPVSEVAAAAHATVRTLERNFKQSSGHTVKDVAALIRFEQARNQLWQHPNTNIAGLAHDLGYTDQSHLSREFKRYSGTTPAAFARNVKKGQRVVANNFVAFIQS